MMKNTFKIILLSACIVVTLAGCSAVKSRRDKAGTVEILKEESSVYGAYLSAELKTLCPKDSTESFMFAVRQETIKNEITMQNIKTNYFGKKMDFRTWLMKTSDRFMRHNMSLDKLVKKSMLSDFLVRNKTRRLLDSEIPSDAKYFILTSSEEARLEKKRNPKAGAGSYWENFKEKYPTALKTGIYSFSRAGFNNKMDQAMVLVSNSKGIIGEGKVIVFQKRKGKWSIKNKLTLWTS